MVQAQLEPCRCRLPRQQEMKRQRNNSNLREIQSNRTSPKHNRYQLKIVQVYAPTTTHSDDETGSFYNTIDKILEKQSHYTIIAMVFFSAKVGGPTNTAGKATGGFGLGQQNERGESREEMDMAKP